MFKKITTRFLVQSAVIAALYAALTLAFAPISYGNLQVRISEALTVLPAFTPAAIPGLFIGCIISNSFSPLGLIDVVVGSTATLIAALLSYKMPKRWLVPVPPIIVNGIIIGIEVAIIYELPILATMGWVALGQTIACYALGYPLIMLLDKHKSIVF